MPRMNIDFSDDTYDTICRVAQKLKISKKAAIEQCVRNASTMRQKCVNDASEMRQPRERASSPSAQKENNKYNTITETAGFDASRISSFSSLGNNKENSKKAPPDFLPDDWEPPKEFQHEWCRKRDYCYQTALDIFTSKFKADPQRCSDWDSKWRYFLLNGYLKGAKFSELESEEDSYGLAIGRFNPNAL